MTEEEWKAEIERRDEIINSNKDLIATLYDDLKRELKLKNDLVLMAYPAMDAVKSLTRHLDTFKYANDVMTIVQIRELISAPRAENSSPFVEGCPEKHHLKCQNMKCVSETMAGERYRCEVCGESYFLDYEEMR